MIDFFRPIPFNISKFSNILKYKNWKFRTIHIINYVKNYVYVPLKFYKTD